MGIEFEPDTGLQSEGDLKLARYAFATEEAQRVIAAHGPEVVARIIDAARSVVPATGRIHSQRLVDAVEAVTGIDMAARLAAYDDGLAGEQYHARIVAALQDRDFTTALPLQLRWMEKENFNPDGVSLDFDAVRRTAWMLSQLHVHRPAAGETYLRQQIQTWTRRGEPEAAALLRTAMLYNALLLRRPRAVAPEAQTVLENRPLDRFALTVRMVNLHEAGRLEEARDLARMIRTGGAEHRAIWGPYVDRVLAEE
jgi:hypothetical protein